MRYIKISNFGEIEPSSFKLIGASSKRNSTDKIGYFGSGLKYSMAFMLRNKMEFKVFSGTSEIHIGIKNVLHRDQEFEMITVNGEGTSMTTTMGPDWDTWGVLREVYCNALDESDSSIDTVTSDEVRGEGGYTSIYIQMNSELIKIVDNWNHYFSNERGDVVADINSDKLFHGTSDFIIYRKGIQCHHENVPCIFNYDMQWAEINESRVLSNMFIFKMKIVHWLFRHANDIAIKKLIDSFNTFTGKDRYWEHSLDWSYTINNTEVWRAVIGTRILVCYEISGWFEEELNGDRYKYLVLPMTLATELNKQLGIPMLGINSPDQMFAPVKPDKRSEFVLNEVSKFFEEVGYKIEFPIEIVKFQNSNTLGLAHNGTIYLSNKLPEMGKKKLAEVIYEENEHLKTGYADLSRSFQTHLINQVISKMEEHHAYFL